MFRERAWVGDVRCATAGVRHVVFRYAVMSTIGKVQGARRELAPVESDVRVAESTSLIGSRSAEVEKEVPRFLHRDCPSTNEMSDHGHFTRSGQAP